MMNSRRGAAGQFREPEGAFGAEAQGTGHEDGWSGNGQGSGLPGDGHRKRRRQRSQRGKQRYPGPGRSSVAHIDTVNRERMFQDVEGLLRQIREEAEEAANWPEQRLSEIVQTVTVFNKLLEEQSDPIPERVRGEYQRVREKLTHALKIDHGR